MPIKVVITDDHPLAISGIQNILNYFPDIQVVGAYTSGDELLTGLQHQQPDVLLLDILMPGKTGKDVAVEIRESYPHIRILVLTSLDAPSHVEGMIRRGCAGYLLKNTDPKTLVKAIEQVYRGEQFMDPSLKEQLVKNVLKLQEGDTNILSVPKLTLRERQILKLIIEEHTSQEIADKLFVSLRTVDFHRYNLMQKLDVKNTVGLIKVSLRMGLLE